MAEHKHSVASDTPKVAFHIGRSLGQVGWQERLVRFAPSHSDCIAVKLLMGDAKCIYVHCTMPWYKGGRHSETGRRMVRSSNYQERTGWRGWVVGRENKKIRWLPSNQGLRLRLQQVTPTMRKAKSFPSLCKQLYRTE